MTAPKRSEDLELIKFFEWVDWHAKVDNRLEAIYHVANERSTSWASGKILKQKGVRSGIPDVFCAIPSHGSHGLFIEFKIAPNKLTANQERFFKLFYSLGYTTKVAWSGDEAIQILKEYLVPSS